MSPSPAVSHQRVLGRLSVALHRYVQQHDLGGVYFSPADLSWGRDDVIVQPDLFVVSPANARADLSVELSALLSP